MMFQVFLSVRERHLLKLSTSLGAMFGIIGKLHDFSDSQKSSCHHGEQIGRLFANWVIVY
jgi:hypothetical protein